MPTNGGSEVAASAADVIQSMEASADGVFTKSAFASRVGTLAGAFASASASLNDFRNVLRWPSRTRRSLRK
ncbi:MAG: hypothetical protein ACTS45_01455 [Candidatus Hodgkinia cicadicola]